MKVGIIGCGTIGAALARALQKKFSRQAKLCYVADHHPAKARRMRRFARAVRIVGIPYLIRHSDLILEAAAAEVAGPVALQALQYNKRVLIMSVGGLLKNGSKLKRLKTKGRLFVPSGAIAGLDGLAAAHHGKIRRVKLITRKPPRGLEEAPYFQKRRFPKLKANEEKCVFRGSALQAVRGFPKNINVAAALSLAGIGARRTQVEIWTSGRYRHNTHEVLVEGRAGRLRTVTENLPSPDNPKTSALAYYSAIAALEKILKLTWSDLQSPVIFFF